ncbi:LPO_1073/Vpar_1526 family protein [Streptomyces sp. NPDC098789]|uniref:LPO_1073/Vpar_1526 family protein n=1 Tax=Streptomyces sp. NPDC098789 TaxID=3366098 RepID=UPI00382B507C
MKWLQRQVGGDSSTNIQTQSLNIGLNYADVREIAMDVFRENFAKLSAQAHSIAFARAEDFIDNLVTEMKDRAPQAIQNIQDPGVQSDLLEAQSGYAKSGDRDLGEVLCDLLVDRCMRTDRNLSTLALSAAISVAPKLTTSQLAALSFIFAVKETREVGVTRLEELYERIAKLYEPLSVEITRLTPADIQYLVGLGCTTMSVGRTTFGDALSKTYPGFFTTGFTVDEASPFRALTGTSALVPALRDSSKWQIAAVNFAALHQLLAENNLLGHETGLTEATTNTMVQEAVVSAEFGAARPDLSDAIEAFAEKSLMHCRNTAIGTAIGHANLRRVTNGLFSTEIEVWIS